MKVEEINNLLENSLTEAQILNYTEKQNDFLSILKKGSHLYIEGGSNLGIRTFLQLYSISKAPQAFEGAPRVLWFTSSVESVQKSVREMRPWIRRSEIVIETGDDKGKIIQQRNDIFTGADIIIGNPRRLLELYNQNGFHVGKLQLVIVSNLNEICPKASELQAIRRIFESLPKCQKIMTAKKSHHRINEFCEELMEYYTEVNLNSDGTN